MGPVVLWSVCCSTASLSPTRPTGIVVARWCACRGRIHAPERLPQMGCRQSLLKTFRAVNGWAPALMVIGALMRRVDLGDGSAQPASSGGVVSLRESGMKLTGRRRELGGSADGLCDDRPARGRGRHRHEARQLQLPGTGITAYLKNGAPLKGPPRWRTMPRRARRGSTMAGGMR